MNQDKTILVSGAFGQLGAICLRCLLSEGYRVVAMDIKSSKTAGAETALLADVDSREHLTIHYVDLLDRDAVEKTVLREQPTAIIHLAAIVSPPCYSNPELASRINVDGTRALVDAARKLSAPPVFVFASSSAVYGSRNPFIHSEKITLDTPVKPIDCYGDDKIAGEALVSNSGLPYAILRLAGVISPAGLGNMKEEYLVLVRATPRDNRVHAVDARDAARAFINATALAEKDLNRVFLIGGNASYEKVQRELEDDVMESIGIGRLGKLAGLPGNPEDELGWSFTDWYDTAESEAILQFQHHDWQQTRNWVGSAIGPRSKMLIRLLSPLIRVLMLSSNIIQRKLERRGKYADPWKLIVSKYGEKVLSSQQ